jgi:hypothetical protein
MIWAVFGDRADKKRPKICTKRRSFPAVSFKQRRDACILIEGTTPRGKSRCEKVLEKSDMWGLEVTCVGGHSILESLPETPYTKLGAI